MSGSDIVRQHIAPIPAEVVTQMIEEGGIMQTCGAIRIDSRMVFVFVLVFCLCLPFSSSDANLTIGPEEDVHSLPLFVPVFFPVVFFIIMIASLDAPLFA